MIRRLMFAAIVVQINIIIVMNRLSQYLSQPHKIHLQAAKHVLRYLTDSPQLEILYKLTGDLISYADAAYANTQLFRSTMGFCFMISRAPVSWTSKQQSITAQFTTESEYIALNEAGKQAV